MRAAIIIAFWLPMALSQDVDQIDFSTIDELREREEKALEEITIPIRRNNSRIEAEVLTRNLKDIMASPVFKGHIVRGSLLINLKTGAQEELTKDLYVKAYVLSDPSGYLYLQGKGQTPIYKTLEKNVSNISEVTKMREPPLFYEPVVKAPVENINDKNLIFFTETNLHLGLSSPRFTRDLLDSRSSEFGKAVNYELQGYSMFALPFFIGLNLMAETASGNLGGGETYSYSALSLGPIFKSPYFEFINHKLLATVGLRTNLYGKLTANRVEGRSSFRVAQTSLFLGLQKNYQVRLGEIVLGVNFQRQWSRGKSENEAIDISSESNYDDSFAITLGHRMSWL